jgi:heme-degrading monooxygenase HmoA
MKERLILFLAYLGIGQTKFESKVGLSRGLINNIKGNISLDSLKKITDYYPELNSEWLTTGEGSMLKPTTIHQENAHIESHHGGVSIGQVTGGKVKHIGNKEINHIHPDEGKDMVIEKQEQQVEYMFKTLLEELRGFHGISERRDEYVKKQDEYIARIIKHSYLRNEENMKRIDKLIEQQNTLIQMFALQNEKTQDRADRLLVLLEKKM